ncbi:hypothetical protein D3C80_1761510 [compost metagenome]
MRLVGRGHLDARTFQHAFERLDVLGLVVRRIRIGDVAGHHVLADGQPLGLPGREFEKLNRLHQKLHAW